MTTPEKSEIRNVHSSVLIEEQQSPETRVHLYEDAEKFLGRPLIAFFTSFSYPVEIEDQDADMLQSVLGQTDLSNGLALLINSPGGAGLAAERIINICRSYSDTNEYWCVVPGKAKSAATMVCMGSSKIYMAPMSELGPIDPQIIGAEDGQRQTFSAHSLVSTYDELFKGAAQAKGNLEPYLQQLAKFDAREISEYKSVIELAEDIAIKTLQNGMMKGKSKAQITRDIKVFLDPTAGTLSHGRPIYADEAKSSGLNIEDLDVKSDLWKVLYELYVRMDKYVSSRVASKAVESKQQSFHVPSLFWE